MRRVQHSFLLLASIAAPCAFAQTAPVNLALNKPIAASSTENPVALKAANANDGDLGTRWGSEFVSPTWITVDLGSEQSIGRVVLRWENAYATAYTIRVSNDGTTWSTVHTKTNGQGGTEDISFTPVLARYVSMYGTQKNGIYGYSLHEFEVYATSGGSQPDPDPTDPTDPAEPGTAPTVSYNARVTGNQTEPAAPFNITEVAAFNNPWGLDFLPDGRIVVTEKSDRMYIVTPAGVKTSISGLPVSVGANGGGGQSGLHDVATSPTFAQDRKLWFSYVAKGADNNNHLTLASARLDESGGTASLSNLQVIWQEPSSYSVRGQPGARIAFAPNGQHVYLAVGDGDIPAANGDRGHVAQQTDSALGKIIRLNLDGSTPSDNPEASLGGVRGQVWAKGFRNPYGLAFDGSGNLWLNEMGPASGDEFNFIIKGANYGWPLVSNGNHYNGDAYMPGQPYPRHDTAPQFTPPAAYWGWFSTTNSMSPSGLAFYNGNLFPQWKGSALLGSTSSIALYRVVIDPATNNVTGVERYGRSANNVYTGAVRALKVSPLDGSIWYVKGGGDGALRKLTPQ
ncbi:PQQ-dependent sugar dehydrogenase [Cystobacter ferrugineus]|uniref:PQQ-dependent sugar dehydrogenase n=1 Tax=Cystobacter ferrugineus TaxID=83449 RepID=UPI000A5DFF02|nr:PQQ-dependent sugar dehydrogenase [Cystobacter ferrugineus]